MIMPLKLRDLIRERSVRTGQFTLASGKQTNYFIDLKKTILYPLGATLIADVILEQCRLYLDDIDAFGGMATGAIPLVAAVCTRTCCFHQIPGFYVRPVRKGHGTDQIIDGCLEPGMRVVLLEDVTTTGQSVLTAAQAVRDYGCVVNEVITVVDRLEGAADLLQQYGLSLTTLMTKDDLKI